jgi:hypothetical protein
MEVRMLFVGKDNHEQFFYLLHGPIRGFGPGIFPCKKIREPSQPVLSSLFEGILS